MVVELRFGGRGRYGGAPPPSLVRLFFLSCYWLPAVSRVLGGYCSLLWWLVAFCKGLQRRQRSAPRGLLPNAFAEVLGAVAVVVNPVHPAPRSMCDVHCRVGEVVGRMGVATGA